MQLADFYKGRWKLKGHTIVVQLLSHVQLFVTPWTGAHQNSLSFTISWSLLILMSTESVMPSNHFILCHPLLLLPSIFPNISLFCCFPLFLCIDHWGRISYLSLLFFVTLHSNGYIFPFLLCLSLLFFSQLFARPPETTILAFCICFSWGWSWSLPPTQCHEPPSIVLQALCLSDLIPWIYLSFPLYNHKGFDLGHTWMV